MVQDLTVSKEERKAQEKVEVSHFESDIPFGLHVHLGETELKKLGIDTDKVEIGSEVMAKVRFRVTGKSESETENSKRRHVDMGITGMELAPQKKTMEERATALFGGE